MAKLSTRMAKFQFPTAQTVLLLLAVVVAALTWVIPSGQFDRLSYDAEKQQFIQRGERDTSNWKWVSRWERMNR